MHNITNVAELKSAIVLLEIEQEYNEQQLKEQFRITYNSLKPVNIIKNTFKDVVTSPFIIDNILDTAIGIASGYVTKKLVVGFSSNIFRKLLGSVLQYGVSNVVTQHPESIKSAGQSILQHIFKSKKSEAKS